MLITAPQGGQLDSTEAQTAAVELRRAMIQVDGVDRVGQPTWSDDRRALLLPISLARDADKQPDAATLETGDRFGAA